jgi:hypothetical protein
MDAPQAETQAEIGMSEARGGHFGLPILDFGLPILDEDSALALNPKSKIA